MKIAIGSDHAGFNLKEVLKKYLEELNYQYTDFGTYSLDTVDYPDIGFPVAEAVSKGEFQFGILICGSGIGMDMLANKIPGLRSVLCADPLTARYSRSHNDANIICLGERIVGPAMACEIVRVFLTTEFSGGRHQVRIDKIKKIEEKYLKNKK